MDAHNTSQYLDYEAEEIDQEMMNLPEFKTLFKTICKVSREDLKAVQALIDAMANKSNDDIYINVRMSSEMQISAYAPEISHINDFDKMYSIVELERLRKAV